MMSKLIWQIAVYVDYERLHNITSSDDANEITEQRN